MSGNTIGGIAGAVVGFIVGGPAGARWGFTIGSMLGGMVDPQKIYGPRLKESATQPSQSGVPIPFGWGTYVTRGHLIWRDILREHKNKKGGKGGPQQIEYTYTRSYAIAVGKGELTAIQQIRRNGKLVYDISPTSTIAGRSAKFLRKCTIYLGTETQTTDPVIEAVVGATAAYPHLGLAYIVLEDDDLTDSAGAVPTYEFVVQKCGAVSYPADTMQMFIAGLESIDSVASSTRTGTWTSYPAEIPGNVSIRKVAANNARCIAYDTSEQFYYSTDRGANWIIATDQPPANRQWRHLAFGPGVGANSRALAVAAGTGVDAGKSYIGISYDGGDHWSFSQLTGIVQASCIEYAEGIYVLLTTSTGSGIYTASDPAGTWTLRSTETDLDHLCFNGEGWLAVGGNAKTCSAPASAQTWTDQGSPGTGSYSYTCLTGGPGYFVAGATDSYGIYRTTNLGATWTNVLSGGTDHGSAAAGLGVIVMGDVSRMRFSTDDGLTWTNHAPPAHVNSIAYMGPSLNWYQVPDGDGLYADENGNLVTDYADLQQVAACGATLGDIVADICEMSDIASTERDVSQLTDFVKGFSSDNETTGAAMIEALAQAYFFDVGEWDKKIRFIKRGGAPVAALTVADLLSQGDDVPLRKEEVQEVELLRKVIVRALDPAANYMPATQPAERRISTLNAIGESMIDIPLVATTDTMAQIADKRLKVAWDETVKFAFAYSLAWSKLTPTDVITLEDESGYVHRMRLTAVNQELGRYEVEEAMKDRAETYESTATGSVNDNVEDPSDGLRGPTLFVAMNLPQMRSQDSTPGVYIGATGILSGWAGCQLLVSYDGGVSYETVLTITEGTIMGPLTEDITSGGTPLAVHVFGGELESKTTAQVSAGGNYSAVLSGSTAEVLAYEDATETSPGYYDLETLSRGLEGTTAAAHAGNDMFMDLGTAYFLPIDPAYFGDTLYFKAVSLGTSADAVDPVALVYEAWEFVYDGGGDP